MRILFAEDEEDLNRIVTARLTEEGYSIDSCADGEEAIDCLDAAEYDAIIADCTTGAYISDKPLDIDELLKTLGLYEHRHKLPNQLSGGQQQRVSIGRAIVKNPDILLCDEPTGALDYSTSKEILQLIEQVNEKYGNTIIMVTHNEAIKQMADHVIKLRDGRIRHDDLNTAKIKAADLEW